ncbi:hypothetical protein [Sphingorhabdus sp. SMR4y]|uniref:hypothetical protein n=1 Tax=Sphingorhabdus sp. SMR4y TaxID=2584094 RepID=UPI000B5C23C1|nr:hypothetical protein [Sphingorhabdus sp. SMR4y]ASK88489.1 hypothetical protein SPHFLASMR4Y_01742 [Sphingorhabdus sp. SMR4y]
MCLNRKFVDAAKDAQKDVFEACPIARKILAHKTQLSPSTVDKHANGDSVMNIAAFNGYAKAGVDPELLSLLLPDGFQIVKTPEGINHDELAEVMHEYLKAKSAAHHPESEDGREIGPKERDALNSKIAQIGVKS